jgi:ornithine decarboxylase
MSKSGSAMAALAQEPAVPPEISLDLNFVRRFLETHEYQRPVLLLDRTIVRAKARRFLAAMPRVRPHYAVKANPHPAVLRVLKEEGVRFEIASNAELDLLLQIGVDPHDVLYSNPVKARAWIRHAARAGVEWFVLDSVEELEKIFSIAPKASLYLRIDTPNIGSDWPLAGKFGAHPGEARQIIARAAELGSDLAGITFHAGSQCRNPENWHVGIEKALACFDSMRALGLTPRLLNVGGGFPVRHTKPIPAIEEIAAVINSAIAELPANIEVVAEPGRFMVSDSAYLVCRVIGTTSHAGAHWMYWDAGVFGGLIETADGLNYRIETDRHGLEVPWNIGGPTCDSVDVVLRDFPLPADLVDGDFIYIKNAGAYTTPYASEFNGFPLPAIVVV